jgi:triosephosphate isomerase
MRKKIVAGNWKMNLNRSEATELINNISEHLLDDIQDRHIWIFPPFPFLTDAVRKTAGTPIKVGAQNCSMYTSGAYTGEVAADMIASCDAELVLVGHSERRQYFNESNLVLTEKINQALSNNLCPVYCVGETLEERQGGKVEEVIEKQLVQALYHLSADKLQQVVIAYEPVWAIGTGETATPDQAQEVHAFIRKVLAGQYGEDVANEISILYGGSVKPANAEELFAMNDIDGGLIGGASLKASDFIAIFNAL